MQAARAHWIAKQRTLDPTRLLFLDQPWTSTNKARRYGRAPKRQRLLAPLPRGHWKTTPFIAALTLEGGGAPLVADGPINGALFLQHGRELLCPTLKPADTVVMDNLCLHKAQPVREAIEATGATLLHLSPYSPDFNPIELYFSKFKAAPQKNCCPNRRFPLAR